MGTFYLEDYNPEVKQSRGIYTRYGFNSKPQTLASAATVTVPTVGGTLLLHTPTQNETLTAATQVLGQTIRLLITTSGVTSYTLTFGTGFVSQGTLATGTVSGKKFIIEFVSDGTAYTEVARTAAM